MTPITPLPIWPPSTAELAAPLPSLQNTVRIAADRARVFAYATNPFRWHEWHPATRSVEGVPDRPALEGETVLEHIRVGGRRFSARWTVLAVEAPTLWVIGTDTPHGVACLSYRLSPVAGPDGSSATLFQRTLACRSKGRLLRLLDPLMMRLVLAPQSARALRNLQRAVESMPTSGASRGG